MPRRELEHSQDPVRGQPVCSQHHAKTNSREARAYDSWLGPVSQPNGSCLYSTPCMVPLQHMVCIRGGPVHVVHKNHVHGGGHHTSATSKTQSAGRHTSTTSKTRRMRGMVASGLAGNHSDGSWSACCPLQRRRIGTRISCARSASDGPRCTARTSVLCPAHFAAGHASRPTHPNHPTLTKKGWKTRG